MSKTIVVNIHKNDYDVYIGRQGKGKDGYFGNPIKINEKCFVCENVHTKSGDTINCFEKFFYMRLEIDEDYKNKILSLSGKRLGCFCKPKNCHGDIIANYLNNFSSLKSQGA